MMLDTPKTTKSIQKIPLTNRAYDALLDLCQPLPTKVGSL